MKPVAPASPPRKVVSDFKAFGASPTASVFGTAVQSTPFSLAGGKAAFGALRGNGKTTAFDDDEDEDDGDGRQRVELREDSITLDQVRTPGLRPCMSPWLTVGFVSVGSAHCDAERVEKYPRMSLACILWPARSCL